MYTREITVLPSDSSCQGTIKLRSLLDYFQDTAGMAVEDIEGTATELAAKGYAWVLTRYEIEFIGKLPTIDEKFTLKTFHDPSHGYNTLRVFQVSSLDGRPLVWAKTCWLLLDLTAGRPVKPVSHIEGIASRDTENIPTEFREIPDFADVDTERESVHHVSYHDLDYNGHVNNAVYFEWVHDSTPVDFMTQELKSVSAAFRSGAKFGEEVTLKIARRPEESCFVHKVIRENVKKPSAMFMCTWGNKNV